jgi:hypothetical protein
MDTKVCGRCKKVQPISLFHKCASRSDGLQFKCIDCENEIRKMGWTPCIDCGRSGPAKNLRCNRCEGLNRRGINHHQYTTGKNINNHGYVILTGKHDHPNSYSNGSMLEHVFIVSEDIGRALLKGEMVHHKNGIRTDNRIENLELCWTQPPGQRVEDLISYLESTGYEVRKL